MKVLQASRNLLVLLGSIGSLSIAGLCLFSNSVNAQIIKDRLQQNIPIRVNDSGTVPDTPVIKRLQVQRDPRFRERTPLKTAPSQVQRDPRFRERTPLKTAPSQVQRDLRFRERTPLKTDPDTIVVKSFAKLCEEKYLSTSERKTIDVLLKQAGTKDCKKADTNLRNWDILGLSNEQITNLSPLITLKKNLANLILEDNPLRDISPLAELTNLYSLYLSGNQIRNVKPLASLSNNLSYLDLRDNQISDVSPLASLTKLTYLDLRGNRISDIQALASLKKLKDLFLDGNQICPLEPKSRCHF
jgi:hypothetical protein